MLRTDYERIFLGSSCFALGCAARQPKDTLIIESGEGFGGEFVDALRADGRPIIRPQGEGAAFYEELKMRGILDDESAAQGRIHLPAVNIILNRWMLEKKVSILFRTRVFEITSTDAGYAIRGVCNARVFTFTCRKLIDTRSNDFSRIHSYDPGARIALGANLQMAQLPDVPIEGLSIVSGYLPGEVYAHMNVEGIGDREKLFSAFEKRPKACLEARLLTVCHTLAVWCVPIRERTDKGLYLPGCGFDNPVQAFAAGLCEGESME